MPSLFKLALVATFLFVASVVAIEERDINKPALVPEPPVPAPPQKPLPAPAPAPKQQLVGQQPVIRPRVAPIAAADADKDKPKPAAGDIKDLKVKPSGPPEKVVKAGSVTVTATPTTNATAKAIEKRAEKPAAPSLLNVKVKNTTVTISPMGIIKTKNPDIDIDMMKVAQMLAQFVQTIQKIVEASKVQSKASPTEAAKQHRPVKASQWRGGGFAAPDEVESGGADDDDDNDDDSDGVEYLNQPVFDDRVAAQPYAQKLPWRVRREAIIGGGPNTIVPEKVNFEGAAVDF